MLFYHTRRTNMPSTRRGVSRHLITSEPGGASLHVTWMLKSFAMGVTLLGLSYWLVQLSGFQYLVSLTGIALFAFLLVYLIWCFMHRNKMARQRSDGSSRAETSHISTAVGNPVATTPDPPPPFDSQQTFKYVTRTPGRDQSPPPTYEEAIRAMMRMVTCTPELTCHPPVSPDTGSIPSQQRQEAVLASTVPTVSVPRLNSSIMQLSPSVLLSSSDLTRSLSFPSALIPQSSPVVQTHSTLTLQESLLTPLSPSGETAQQSATLTQTTPTALTPSSTVLLTPSEHSTPHAEVS